MPRSEERPLWGAAGEPRPAQSPPADEAGSQVTGVQNARERRTERPSGSFPHVFPQMLGKFNKTPDWSFSIVRESAGPWGYFGGVGRGRQNRLNVHAQFCSFRCESVSRGEGAAENPVAAKKNFSVPCTSVAI